MKIIKWISWGKTEKMSSKKDIGWLGGTFRKLYWEEYLQKYRPWVRPYLIAVRKDILKKKIKHGGDWHQKDPHGIPLFEDGCYLALSYRAWGDLLSAIWNTVEKRRKYNYLDFYMTLEYNTGEV